MIRRRTIIRRIRRGKRKKKNNKNTKGEGEGSGEEEEEGKTMELDEMSSKRIEHHKSTNTNKP